MLNNNKHRASNWRDWLVRAATGALFIIVYSNSFAAEVTGLETEDSFLGDIPIVLSATRLAQPRSDAPAAVSIIDRQMIEASGATEITDLFRLVPGFQIGHDSSSLFSTDPVAVTYHGLSDAYARRIQVLIDGRSVYSPDFGGVRWNDLPLEIDDIERIEVIRGPNGSTFGANSFMAVINIITRHPADVVGTSVKMVMGGNNFVKGVVRHAVSSDKFDYRLTLVYRSDSGFENQYDNEEIGFASYSSEYRIDNDNVIEFNFGLGSGAQQAGIIGQTNENSPRTTGSNTNFQQIKWTRKTVPDSEHRLQYYRNYLQYNDKFTATASNTPINQGIVTERNNVEYQYIRTWNKKLRSVWGAEIRQDVSQADEGWFWESGKVSNNLYRVFANAELRVSPKLLYNFGAMVEYTDFTGAGFSPSLALNYKISESSTVRAKVSEGLRNPSLLESKANTYINLGGVLPTPYFDSDANISPEKIRSYEIGYFYESRKRSLEADVRIFRDEITNLISFPAYSPPPPTGRFTNGGYSTITGAEFEINYKPTTQTRVIIAYSLTAQEGEFLTNVTASTETFKSSAGVTPRETLGMLGIYNLNPKTSVSIGYYHVDSFGWFSTITQLPAYNKVDVRLSRKFKWGSGKGNIELVAQNLADSYITLASNSKFERRIFVKLRLQK